MATREIQEKAPNVNYEFFQLVKGYEGFVTGERLPELSEDMKKVEDMQTLLRNLTGELSKRERLADEKKQKTVLLNGELGKLVDTFREEHWPFILDKIGNGIERASPFPDQWKEMKVDEIKDAQARILHLIERTNTCHNEFARCLQTTISDLHLVVLTCSTYRNDRLMDTLVRNQCSR